MLDVLRVIAACGKPVAEIELCFIFTASFILANMAMKLWRTLTCDLIFFFLISGDHRDLHSFPTRRSSDLIQNLLSANVCSVFKLLRSSPKYVRLISARGTWASHEQGASRAGQRHPRTLDRLLGDDHWTSDRKSTRLNSSHANISYAVFCLK